jgi:flagellar assembly protein FliH
MSSRLSSRFPANDDAAAVREDAAPRKNVLQERMTAWQRWEMAAFLDPVPSAPEPKPEAAQPEPEPQPELQQIEPVLLIDEAELERLRLEAQRSGELEGRRLGYAQGHTEGYSTGRAAAQNEAERLRALAATLPDALRGAERDIAEDLLSLALDIAGQVLRQALATNPQAILTVVRELLHTEPALSGSPRLMLHADDAALVREYLGDDLQAAGWTMLSDASITRGGCRVQAASGELDATLETRWERVAAALGRGGIAPITLGEAAHD